MKEKIKKIFKIIVIGIFSMLIVGGIGGLVYYLKFLKSLEYTVYEFPMDVSNQNEFRCESITEYGVMPQPKFGKGGEEKIKASIGKKGEDKTKVAIGIEENKLRFITSVSVEMGISEPAYWTIVRNDQDKLTAIDVEKTPTGEVYHTFVLDKKTGFATWTKNVSTDLLFSLPYVIVVYFICR